jgi:hypothetical protein
MKCNAIRNNCVYKILTSIIINKGIKLPVVFNDTIYSTCNHGGGSVGTFSLRIMAVSHTEFSRAPRSWAGCQAVYQYKLPSLSQGTKNSEHSRSEVQCEWPLKRFQDQSRRKCPHRPGLEPGPPDS